MKRILAILSFTLLAGCAGGTLQRPDQVVFAARGAQNVALRAAVGYKELKPCAAVPVQPCSDKAVVAQLQLADRVADQALGAAESAVRSKGFGADIVNSAVTAATAALSAFQAIVATIGGK